MTFFLFSVIDIPAMTASYLPTVNPGMIPSQSLDPATAILEVAVHKVFRALDTVAHMMTAAVIADPAHVHVVDPAAVPNPNWLRPGIPGAGQQAFGDALLRRHRFVAIPSAVSTHSWNLIFLAGGGAGAYSLKFQETFALDTRLHPPGS